MDTRFDRAFRAPYDRCNFCHGEVFEKIQDQNFLVFRREFIQSLVDGISVIFRKGRIG